MVTDRQKKRFPLLPVVCTLLALLMFSGEMGFSHKSAKADPPGNSSWNMLFDDEFNGSSLDSSKWVTCWYWAGPDGGCTNGANGQLSYALPKNVSVSNGMLHLTTVKEDYTPPGSSTTYHWTSGMVTSDRIGSSSSSSLFAYQYGYMELRGRLATGDGIYNAFWTGAEDHSWPPELDTYEILGDRANLDHMTYHWSDSNGNQQQSQDGIGASNFTGAWHTYGLDWQPGLLIWYVDGREVTRSTVSSGVAAKAMFLMLSAEVWQASAWTSGPDASTPTTSVADIDYVRVWQRQGNQSNPPPVSKVSPVANFGSAGIGSSTYDMATDGSFDTAFDAADPTNCFTGIDAGSNVVVDKVRYSPRKWENVRMPGGVFQGATSEDGPWTTLYTIQYTPWYDVFSTAFFSNTTPYRYYRYVGPPDGHCNIAEMEFDPAATHGQLTPVANFGTAGIGSSTYALATDGSFDTAFDAVDPTNCFTGIDVGYAAVVTQIKYSPRKWENDRMSGGVFQGANSQDGGWTTLYTIPDSYPPYDTFTAATFDNTSAYRYYRYVGPPDGHCNISEMQFFT